jgi:RNA polymerase sigma-70 factor (ECF subfamily)
MAPGMKTGTDHELMTAVARGDLASMTGIYEHRNRALFRFFYRLTGRQALAEDLTHEVFLRMIRYRHTYERGEPEEGGTGAKPDAGFESWMYRIARNAYADHRRKHRLETEPAEDEAEQMESGHMSAFDAMAKQQDLATLYRALRRLPEDRRELILMARFQGLNYEQIGRILDCEPGAVKGRMFRAMKEVSRIYMDLRGEARGSERVS